MLRGRVWGLVCLRPVRGALALGAATVLLLGGLTGASADTAGTAAAGPVPKSCVNGGPGIRPCIPQDAAKGHGTQDSATFLDGNATDHKAKQTITLPMQVQRVYANETFKSTDAEFTSDQPAWVVTNPGKNPTFGTFPVVKGQTVLAFGAIPVKADIALTQIIGADGLYEPIDIFGKTVNSNPPVTTVTVTAQVDLALRNVMVDTVPLDVGTDCHTSTPIQLTLHGVGAYTVFFGGTLQGTFTIPPFTGCHNGAEDLDPLLTGTVAGPDNTITLYQGALGSWDPKQTDDCTGCTKPPQ